MPSYGKTKATAVSEPSQPKTPKKELTEISLRKAENGGVIAEHRFNHYEHQAEAHVFGKGEGSKLTAHLSEHLDMGAEKSED